MGFMLPILVMFFPGVYLLTVTGIKARRNATHRVIAAGYRRFHRALTLKLVESGFLSFPGIRLTEPVPSWVCAEMSAVVFGLSYSMFASTPGTLILAIPVGMTTGAICLFFSLKSRSSRNISIFGRDLPLAAFLMSLLMESGMGSAAAMKEAIAAMPAGGCAEELTEILKGRELGVSKRDLFENSRKRVPLDDYRSFLNLIEQGDRLGISLSQGLNELSRRMLEAQTHRAEMLAQQAAVKMLLPLVLFIFPAVFLIILSPVILNLCSMAGW